MRNNPSNQSRIPLPFPELLFQVSRDADQDIFLHSSLNMASALLDNFAGWDMNFDEQLRFLDFGCGVGKVVQVSNIPLSLEEFI